MFKTFCFIFILVYSTGSFACSRKPGEADPTVADQYGAARLVFRARVTATSLEANAKPMYDGDAQRVIGRFELIERYKGKVDPQGSVQDLVYRPGNCSLGLMAGVEYVFFVDGNGLVWIPSGSFGYVNAEATEVAQRLAELRALRDRN